jgi:acetolactate synthase I/III small subunit
LHGEIMKHTISILVENHFGVLARVSGLFSTRGYNIDSLSVSETEEPSVSRITMVVRGDDRVLEQIVNQLNKLVDVIEVTDLTRVKHIERELVMVKINVDAKRRSEVVELASIFRAKVVDMGADEMTIETIGSEGKVDAFIDMLYPFGIQELVRTGKIAIARSARSELFED